MRERERIKKWSREREEAKGFWGRQVTLHLIIEMGEKLEEGGVVVKYLCGLKRVHMGK